MDDREARRRRRQQHLLVRKFELGDEPGDDISATTTAAERLAMMWPLALRTWSLTGQPLPTYTRAEIPSRIIRGRPSGSKLRKRMLRVFSRLSEPLVRL